MKYADLFKHDSSFSVNQHEARISHRKKKSNKIKLYLLTLLCLLIGFLYIRYQIFYNEESLFSRFYHEVFLVEAKKEKKEGVFLLAEKFIFGEKKKKKRIVKKKKAQINRRQKVSFYLLESNSKKGVITVAPEKVVFSPSSKKTYLYDLVNKLIQHQQKNSEYFNSFNENAMLLNHRLEGDTLLLNFNSQFEYNRLGDKGIALQIQQVLWTMFTLPHNEKIKYISFLFDGRRKRVIGGHGFELKPFYSRKDLQKNFLLR